MGEPKKAVDIELPTRLNVMLYGDFATGKTTFATTFPKPLLFFDFDCRFQSYAGVEGIDYILYEDVGRRPTAYRDFMKDLKEYQTGSKYKTLVLDSTTSLADAVKFDILGQVSRGSSASEGLTYPQWGQFTERFQEIFNILSSADKHSVIISHDQMIQDEITGEIKHLAMMVGKKFAMRAPGFFDEVYYCFTEKDRETKDTLYLCRTRSDRRIRARSSMNIRDENGRTHPILDEIESQHFEPIFEKVKEARANPEEYLKNLKQQRQT